eukprot:m.298120 g.298120  ORF g.298120 m.298120 type:complete len:597 (-) comp55174_c0_seq7:67-1857(-)
MSSTTTPLAVPVEARPGGSSPRLHQVVERVMNAQRVSFPQATSPPPLEESLVHPFAPRSVQFSRSQTGAAPRRDGGDPRANTGQKLPKMWYDPTRDCLWMPDETRTKMSDVLSISFNVMAEKANTQVRSQVLVVRRASSLNFSDWVSWMRIVLGYLPLFLLTSMVFGPLSTLLLLMQVPRFASFMSTSLQKRADISRETLVYWLNVVVASAWFVFVVLWSYLLLHVSVPLVEMVALGFLGQYFYKQNPATFLQWRLHDYPVPTATYPIEIMYEQHEIMQMLHLRDRLIQVAVDKISFVSTGSYLSEGFFSMILPSPLYNSHRARTVLHYFLGYVMPFFFAVKFAFFLNPYIKHSWLGYFWKDTLVSTLSIGVDFLVAIPVFFIRMIYALLGGSTGPFVVFEYLVDNSGTQVDFLQRRLGSVFGVALSIDETLTYVKSKTQALSVIIIPFLSFVIDALQMKFGTGFKHFLDLVSRLTVANASLARIWHRTRAWLDLLGPQQIPPNTPPRVRIIPHDSTPIVFTPAAPRAAPTEDSEERPPTRLHRRSRSWSDSSSSPPTVDQPSRLVSAVSPLTDTSPQILRRRPRRASTLSASAAE